MDAQDRVAAFVDDHDMDAAPAYRVLDLAAEVGEVAADAAKSAEYGAAPEDLAVSEDELGDALFALLATADALDVDAGAAVLNVVVRGEYDGDGCVCPCARTRERAWKVDDGEWKVGRRRINSSP